MYAFQIGSLQYPNTLIGRTIGLEVIRWRTSLNTNNAPQHNVKFIGRQKVTIVQCLSDSPQNRFLDFVMFENLPN
jgi:hypothetical protein